MRNWWRSLSDNRQALIAIVTSPITIPLLVLGTPVLILGFILFGVSWAFWDTVFGDGDGGRD